MADTQKVRDEVNCSRLSFATKEEVESILGYKTGAVPPLLLKTEIPVLLDNGIVKKDKVNISSGDPMAGLEINPRDLIPLIKPRFGNFTK